MISLTFRTFPFTNTERQRVIDISADVAAFRRREEPVNLMYMATVPFAFIFEHIDKAVPAAIGYRFGEMVIPDHILDGKAFDVNSLVFANKLPAYLMEKVMPLVRYLFMLSCKSFDCFISICRSSLLSGNSTVKAFKLLLRFPQKVRRFDYLSIRRSKKRLNPVVKPDFTAGIDRIRNIYLAKNRSVVFSRRCHGDSDRLLSTFGRTMKNNLDFLAFRNIDMPFSHRPMLWNGKGLLASFLLKVWKLGALIKEVVVGNVKVSKYLLKGLGINIFKPFKFRLLFQLRQCQSCVMIGQALLLAILVFGIEVNALTQEVIIRKTGAAKVLGKYLTLLTIWIYSVFEGFMYSHA